jgi:anti-sigma factor RsiW
VPVDPEGCPSAETAEDYLRGTLTPADAAEFEDHYITCPKCADALEDTERFTTAMRKAARHFQSKRGAAGD